jgi:GH24 family phage-related lysozyme (muramidase)
VKVSPAGVALIKEFESFPFGGKPYQDLAHVWTIGYGHTEGVGPNSPRITEEQASALLATDLDTRYGPAVNALDVGLNQHQFDALVSFVYNCGTGAIGADTGVGRALRAHDWTAAADHLLDWNKAKGQVIAGLTRRRQAERALFLQQDDPLEGYTANEQHWIREYDKLLRGHQNPARRSALQALMTTQRKAIWQAAQPKTKGGDGHGWDYGRRRARYASLLARTR